MDKQQQTFPQSQFYPFLKEYHNMSVLQLRKERHTLIAHLEQLNDTITEMIQSHNNTINMIQDLDQEIKKEKKLKSTLHKSYQNFQFMITGDYSVCLEQQIVKIKKMRKKLKQQVGMLNRTLAKPMQKDYDLCDELQKQVFHLNTEIEEVRVFNENKEQELSRIITKNNKKAEQIHKMMRKIKDLKQEMQNNDGNAQIQKGKSLSAKFEELSLKKQKLKRFHESSQRKYMLNMKMKQKQFDEVHKYAKQIRNFTTQIDQAVGVRKEQLEDISKRSKHLMSRRKTGKSMHFKRHNKTNEELSTSFLIERERKASRIRESMMRQKFKTQVYYDEENPGQETNKSSLPSIYQILGKRNSILEEEEQNLHELLYY